VYPIPYEWSRLSRTAAAGLGSYLAAVVLVPDTLHAVVRILTSGGLVVAVYGATLYLTGFFNPGELRYLQEVRRRVTMRRAAPAVAATDDHVEMAGEILATTSQPGESETTVSPDSRPTDR
jgi:hypothetical protein